MPDAYHGGMTSRHRPVRLTFPQTQVREPVVYRLGVDYGVVTSIRRASIEDHFGWMVLEMTGEPDQLDAAETYLSSLGIQVDPVLGDIVEG
jgi:ABC-type methionine transport system ATPase subunit